MTHRFTGCIKINEKIRYSFVAGEYKITPPDNTGRLGRWEGWFIVLSGEATGEAALFDGTLCLDTGGISKIHTEKVQVNIVEFVGSGPPPEKDSQHGD